MASPLARLEKGKGPTLLDADQANKVVDLLNALVNSKVAPNGMGSFHVAKDAMTLDLGQLANQIVLINATLDSIINALQNPNFSISCNGDGTITASLTFPVVTRG